MKLSKLNIFPAKNRTIDAATLQHVFLILRGYLAAMFPSVAKKNLTESEINLAKNINDYIIAGINYDEKRPNNQYVEELLPFHTSDKAWLAKYLQQLIKDTIRDDKVVKRILQQVNQQAKHRYLSYQNDSRIKKSVELFDRTQHVKISLNHIQKFIESDPEFNAMLNAYKADLVRAQIKFMMNSRRPNGLLLCPQFSKAKNDYVIKPVYHPVFTRQERNTDYKFRHGVIWAMEKLGIDPHTAEVALEKNAALWREQTMTDAYYNEYELVPSHTKKNLDVVTWCKIHDEREKNKAAWLRQREYQYYQDYKSIIDELNLATPNMKMNETELNQIDCQIANWDHEYQMVTKTTENTKTI